MSFLWGRVYFNRRLSTGEIVFIYHHGDLQKAMDGELSKGGLKDISDAVAPHRHKEVKHLIERFELEEEAETEIELDGNTSDKVYEILKYVEVELRREIIHHLINKEVPLRKDTLEKLKDGLRGSDLELNQDKGGNYELVQTVSGPAQQDKEQYRSYIEKHAPIRTVAFLKRARKELAQGRNAEALWYGRNALEKMTYGNWHYKQGLDELAKKGIGLIDREQNHNDGNTYDFEMLENPYNYCSTIGAHPDDVGSATGLQAKSGLVQVEQAIYFVLKKGEEADEKGINLDRWNFSRMY